MVKCCVYLNCVRVLLYIKVYMLSVLSTKYMEGNILSCLIAGQYK